MRKLNEFPSLILPGSICQACDRSAPTNFVPHPLPFEGSNIPESSALNRAIPKPLFLLEFASQRMIFPSQKGEKMGQEDSKAADIIGHLLDLIESQVIENLAQRLALDLLWEYFPKGAHGGENLGLEPLIDQKKKELAPRVSEKFQAVRAAWLEELSQSRSRPLAEWEKIVRRLIESVRNIDLSE
jgi:hypothetical protein